jgi:hypothetical protein
VLNELLRTYNFTSNLNIQSKQLYVVTSVGERIKFSCDISIMYIINKERNCSLTKRYSPSLETFLLHCLSWGPFLSNIAQEAHLHAAVGHGQGRRVAAFHVDAVAAVTWFTCSPSDFFGLERLIVGTPVHVSRRAAIISAVQPKIAQDAHILNYVTRLMQYS